jgi:uncharacterized repeat protein (TIGR03837 family)
MPLPTDRAPSLAIFCKVVDNYGDIGICWRLARQLIGEHGVAVTLWVDDLSSFRRICPEIDLAAEAQQVSGVMIRHWRDQEGVFAPADIADIVIEFFACDIPPGYIAAMAQCAPQPVWLNLEGLTAEEWVEGCHALTSPRHGMIKHFFFPGFTNKTGGLLREAALDEKRLAFQADAGAMAVFLGQFGVSPAEISALKVSLFCYPSAPFRRLSATMRRRLVRRARVARSPCASCLSCRKTITTVCCGPAMSISCAARIPSCARNGPASRFSGISICRMKTCIT